MGDASSSVSAFFDGPELLVIHERMDTAQRSAAVHKYYIDQGTLFGYLKFESRAAETREGGVDEVTLQLFFDGSGALFHHEKKINRKRADLDDGEVAGIVAHFEQLRVVLLDSGGRRRVD